MDQQRFLLALVLSFLLLYLYEQLVVRPYRTAPRPPVPQGEAGAPESAPVAPGAPSPPTPSGTSGAGGGLAAPAGDHPTVTVETDLFRATITTLGARLQSFQLKDFRETVAPDSPLLDLVTESPVLPLTAELRSGKSDAEVVYAPSTSALDVHGPQEAEISFAGSTSDGRAIEKRYRFTGNSYLFAVDVVGSGSGDRVGIVLTPISDKGASGGRQSGHELAVAFANQKVIEKAPDKLGEPSEIADAVWAGFSAQYFAALAMPTAGSATAWLAISDASPIARVDIPDEKGSARFRVFLGPKDRETLAAAGHDLDRVLDFGWFWFIAIPLLSALRLLHRVIPNYGVNIILLTAIVKAVTLPLTQTSMKSMKAMQKLQPEMQRLRERYKDDQATLQKEVMDLYKRHRVNPVSGCLPMLLQLPIFVGLYNALMHAIELRHAPFVLWINDLAAPDRLPIPGLTPIGSFTGIPVLVILMGGSMLLQQWMTPQQGDPAQQRMMMIMPLVFTFISFNFPSGLVLYWLVNNLLSMAQQWHMLRSDSGGARR
jgi:YidC/Oxa1 family membrane protein insertase